MFLACTYTDLSIFCTRETMPASPGTGIVIAELRAPLAKQNFQDCEFTSQQIIQAFTGFSQRKELNY